MNLVETILRENIEKQRSPSVQYRIFNKDGPIYKFHDGFADIKHSIKANDKTTYHAFSVTKTFTALAILQLVEQGRLKLTDSVYMHLPNFPYPQNITVKQLLTHSAGIPSPLPLNWIHLADVHESFNRDEFFTGTCKKYPKVKFGPNESYLYSNLGYVFLGLLIEKIADTTYEQFIEENIFRKIGLQQNDIGFTIANNRENAKGYHMRKSISNIILGFLIDKSKYMNQVEGKWIAFNDFYVNGPSYGGLIGTPDAFAKYLQELLKRNGSLLSEDSKKMLFTENSTRAGKRTGMCLSWFTGKLNDKVYLTHAGGGGGFYCEIRIYPEREVGSVIMFNRTGMRDERFLDKLDRYFLG